MMEQRDLTTLREMLRGISAPHGAHHVGEVAERLLRLRDRLSFDDADWYHQLTQHVATLDSASTFQPTNDIEKSQVDSAVGVAVGEIRKLVQAKLG